MKTIILVNRVLSNDELFTIERFSYYFDKKKAFVLIGSRTIVAMKEHSTCEEMIANAEKSMYLVLHSHPDFSSYVMDDGNIVIGMNEGIFGLKQGKKVGVLKTDKNPDSKLRGIRLVALATAILRPKGRDFNPEGNKEVPIGIALAVRSECLEAAKQSECIAIVEPI